MILKHTFLTGCIATVLLLSGCGNNLLSGLSTPSSQTSLQQLNRQLDTANSPSDYVSIKNSAQAIVNNPSSTSEDVKEARIIVAQAIIGAANVDVLNLYADIFESINSSSESGIIPISSQSTFQTMDLESEAENIYATIGEALEGLTSADARAAADSINAAYASTLQDSSLEPLSADELLVGGMCNLMVIVRSIDLYLDITSQNVTIKDNGLSISTIVDAFMNPHGLSVSGDFSGDISAFIASADRDGIDEYSQYGFAEFDASGSLPSEMQTFLDEKFENTFNECLELYEAMLSSSGTYTLNSVTYEVGTSYGSREDDILAAVRAIFRQALN